MVTKHRGEAGGQGHKTGSNRRARTIWIYFTGGGGERSWAASWRRKTGETHIVGREQRKREIVNSE